MEELDRLPLRVRLLGGPEGGVEGRPAGALRQVTQADEEGLALFYRLASEEGALSQETAAISR